MPRPEGEDTIPRGPLSEVERIAVRRLLRDESRTRWFWGTTRRAIAWLFGIITSLYVFQDWIAALIAKVLKFKVG